MAYFWTSVKDWKTWAFAIIYMGCDGSLYAFSLFLPSIVQQLYPGISSTKANLLSVPPYAGKPFAKEGTLVRVLLTFAIPSCGCRNHFHRLACGSNQGSWAVQYQHLVPRYRWFRHATWST